MCELDQTCKDLESAIEDMANNIKKVRDICFMSLKNGKYEYVKNILIKKESDMLNLIPDEKNIYVSPQTTVNCQLSDIITLEQKCNLVKHYCNIDDFDNFKILVDNSIICIDYSVMCSRSRNNDTEKLRILQVISSYGSSKFLDSFEKHYFGKIRVDRKDHKELRNYYFAGLIERGNTDRIRKYRNIIARFITDLVRVFTDIDYSGNHIKLCEFIINNSHSHIHSNIVFSEYVFGLIIRKAFIIRTNEFLKCIRRIIDNEIYTTDSIHNIRRIFSNLLNSHNISSFKLIKQFIIHYLIRNNLHRLDNMSIKNIDKYEKKYNLKKNKIQNILSKSIFPKELNNVIFNYIDIYDMKIYKKSIKKY